MKPRHPLLLLTFALLLLLGTVGCDDDLKRPAGDQIGLSADPDDPHFANYTMVTDEVTKGQPEWDGSKPLSKSIQELTKIVLDSFVPAKSQPQTGWRVESIEFKQVPATGAPNEVFPPAARKDRWCGEFDLVAPNNGKYKWWQDSTKVYIFLDGTIIKPQRAKSPANAEWLRDL